MKTRKEGGGSEGGRKEGGSTYEELKGSSLTLSAVPAMSAAVLQLQPAGPQTGGL